MSRVLLYKRCQFAQNKTKKSNIQLLFFVLSNPVDHWWSVSGSNRRPSACKADALPAELTPHNFNDIKI